MNLDQGDKLPANFDCFVTHTSKGNNKRNIKMKASIFFMNDAFKILDKNVCR